MKIYHLINAGMIDSSTAHERLPTGTTFPKNTKPKSGSGECGKFAEVLNGECRMLRRDKLKLRRLRFSDILAGLPQSSFVAMIAVRGIGSCD
jgi:hypothetical protein